jgi:hypothetical protein
MSRNIHVGRSVGAASMAVMLAAAALLAGAGPAGAVPGYQVVPVSSATSSDQTRSVTARCPTTKRLVGGGGVAVSPFFTAISTLTLTQLRPLRRQVGSGRDGYLVSAAETGAGTSGQWILKAYSICMDAVAVGPWSIRESPPMASSSSRVKSTAVGCPPGRRVLGTGARINGRSGGQVFIQVARPSQSGDIARAQAHEDATGYWRKWSVTAYAICAPPPSGYVVPPFGKSVPLGALPTGSDAQVIADVRCPEGKQVLSAGAALGKDAPGSVSLQGMYPSGGFIGSQALAAENTPTDVTWGFMVASSICAS